MTTERSSQLVLSPGVVSGDGTYGSFGRVYGEPGWVYGQISLEPTDPGTMYLLQPHPGGKVNPAWQYRQWDTLPIFEAVLVEDGGAPADYSVVASATLTLTRTNYGPGYAFSPGFDLVVGADRLTRTWEEFDLNEPGTYQASVVVQFDSGRTQQIVAAGQFIITAGEQ